MEIAKMRNASHLLPDPGGEVVRECLDEIERLQGELRLRKAFMDGLPFCPDHRDKVKGKPCRECEIERLQNRGPYEKPIS